MNTMRNDEEQTTSHKALWLGLGIALGGVITGFTIYFILRDRRSMPQLQGAFPQPSKFLPQPIHIWNVVGGNPPITVANPGPAAAFGTRNEALPEGIQIMTLPAAQNSDFRTRALSSREPQRLFTATKDRAWKIQARVVGPAGSVGYFAMDEGPLSYNPPSIMDVSIVPAGETTEIYLSPGSILFGRSDVDDVSVSLNLTSQIPGHVP
jgi:hypothetical protein